MGGKEHYLALTPGKLAGLKQITDASGRFKVLALDQSNSFRKALASMHQRLGDGKQPTYEEIRDAKLEIAGVLGSYASAVLLDVNYGARQAVAAGAIPRGVGLLVRVEASRDPGIAGEVEPGWSVAQIKRMGASAVKLLVYTDVEDAAAMDAQMAFVAKIESDCRASDILLLVEELSYPRKGEDKKTHAYVARRPGNITESAKRIGPHCDVLKLEFPADLATHGEAGAQANLAALNAAAIRPWVLLSAGEKFDRFVTQVEGSMKAGASGIMAGRAIFNEYFEKDTSADRRRFLETEGVQRMKTLVEIVDRHAQPWNQRYGISDADLAQQVRPDWYHAGTAAAPSPESKGEY
jgi:tagatose 1,6-diphosphate aldolase